MEGEGGGAITYKAYSAHSSLWGAKGWKHTVGVRGCVWTSAGALRRQMTNFNSSQSNGRRAGCHPHEEAP